MEQYVTLKDSRIFRDYSSLKEAVEVAEYLSTKQHCPFVVCKIVKRIKRDSKRMILKNQQDREHEKKQQS